MDGFQRRTEVKKQAILSAAKDLFTERGVTDVGISEIAALAHVSQVSIYNYFSDKDTLAREVFITLLDDKIKENEAILDSNKPFREKLQLLIENNRRNFREIKTSQFRQYALKDKALQRIYQEAVSIKSLHGYTKFIEEGKKGEVIDSNIPDDVIQAYIKLILSYTQKPEFAETSEDYKSSFFKLVLHGLFGNIQ
jgi:AcrR family transcriptional regulator